MIRRTLSVPLALCFAFVLPAIALASQPAGIAAELITATYPPSDGPAGLPPPGCGNSSFSTYSYFGGHPLDPGDTLRVELALVPFSDGPTDISLDEIGGQTFLEFILVDGRVSFPSPGGASGLSYNRTGWNDVTVLIRPATQDYLLIINGAEGGPFPFGEFCPAQGGCLSAQALRITNGTGGVGGVIAWIDTIGIAKESPSGREVFVNETFDVCSETLLEQVTGGALIPLKPPRLRRK